MNHGELRQSTANQPRVIGPFVSDSDFKTPATTLTINPSDIKLVKNGTGPTNKNATGASHRTNGMYAVTFDATDTDTLGELSVSILVSGALLVTNKFKVINPSAYDSQFGAGSMIKGVCTTGSNQNSISTSSLIPAVSATDQLKGRIIVFDNDTATAALRGQATDITASTTGGVLTVSQLTTSPASGDRFVIF